MSDQRKEINQKESILGRLGPLLLTLFTDQTLTWKRKERLFVDNPLLDWNRSYVPASIEKRVKEAEAKDRKAEQLTLLYEWSSSISPCLWISEEKEVW